MIVVDKVRGGPTKLEIAHLSLQKLEPRRGDVFLDVGCGTGLISILASEWASKVYAVDGCEEAVRTAEKNIQRCGATNIQVIKGEAPDVLRTLEKVDCAFVGGTKRIEETLEVLSEIVTRKVVVNVARLEVASLVVEKMKELSIFKEALLVQISKGYELMGGLAFRAYNPVFVIVGSME